MSDFQSVIDGLPEAMDLDAVIDNTAMKDAEFALTTLFGCNIISAEAYEEQMELMSDADSPVYKIYCRELHKLVALTKKSLSENTEAVCKLKEDVNDAAQDIARSKGSEYATTVINNAEEIVDTSHDVVEDTVALLYRDYIERCGGLLLREVLKQYFQ